MNKITQWIKEYIYGTPDDCKPPKYKKGQKVVVRMCAYFTGTIINRAKTKRTKWWDIYIGNKIKNKEWAWKIKVYEPLGEYNYSGIKTIGEDCITDLGEFVLKEKEQNYEAEKDPFQILYSRKLARARDMAETFLNTPQI